MHDTSSKYLLQIEPQNIKSDMPVNDELTDKMEKLLDIAETGAQYRGCHTCACGELSGSCDLVVAGYITNSLAVHYLRRHRDDIPESELEKLRSISI